VAKRFEVIEKLILHSYFEYDLLEAAYEFALFTLELALRRRYRELHDAVNDLDQKAPSEPGTLNKLMKWAEEEGLLEDTARNRKDEHVVHGLRRMRNRVAHRKRHTQAGFAALHVVIRIADIINGLYDDVELRQTRQLEEQTVNKQLARLTENGAILELPGQPLILFEASLLYFDNTVDPPIYHFAFWPIFDPGDDNDSIAPNDPLAIAGTSFNVATSEDRAAMETESGQQIILRGIEKAENKARYGEWSSAVDENLSLIRDFVRFRSGTLRVHAKRQAR